MYDTQVFGERLARKLNEYEKVIGDNFPTFEIVSGTPEDEVVEMINNCVKNKKSVEEMGYLPLVTGEEIDGIGIPIEY